MRHEQDVQVVAHATLDRIKQEYMDLLKSPSLSLQKLFAPDHFSLDEYCKKFTPHPQSDQLKGIAQVFGENYGIWLANAKHYITCTLYLYPTADFERMAAIVKNNAVDYYLNDTMGRDVFKSLPSDRQHTAIQIIQRMANIDDHLQVIPSGHAVEIANAEVLTYIRDTSPNDWFSEFLKFYSYHIVVTHKDLNATGLNYISDIPEYIDMRNHTSGMHHIILLIQYNTGIFLDWNWLNKMKLAQSLRRLHWLAATFGALSNDLFSFEKEVIDIGSDSNLVMVIALNHPGLSLNESLFRACGIVRNLLIEFLTLMDYIKREIRFIRSSVVKQIDTHLIGIERCVQASWMWQVYTKRYKRPQSIWEET